VIQIRPDKAELRRLRYRMFLATPAGRVFLVLALLWASATVALAWLTRSWIAPAAMLVLFGIDLTRGYGRTLTKLLNVSVPNAAGQMTYEVASPGITLKGGARHILMPWSSIRSVAEYPEGYVLVGRPHALFISHSWFPDAWTRARVLAFIRQHVRSRPPNP
jgi:hypothetical protein